MNVLFLIRQQLNRIERLHDENDNGVLCMLLLCVENFMNKNFSFVGIPLWLINSMGFWNSTEMCLGLAIYFGNTHTYFVTARVLGKLNAEYFQIVTQYLSLASF